MADMPRVQLPRRLTAAQMLRNPAYRKGWELWDDTLLVREPSGGEAEVTGAFLLEPLSRYVRRRGLGWVSGSNQGFLVARDPDRVLAPDVAFTSRIRLPTVPEAGFFPCAPDLAVEVRSPSDSWERLLTRLGLWLGHGARVAWGIDPLERRVAVLREAGVMLLSRPDDVLVAAPALPRFRVRLGSLFPPR
jgi:Uma2 family endonuclease